MRRLTITILAIAVAFCSLPQLMAQAGSAGSDFRIVAHPSHRDASLRRKNVSNLFLKKESSWPDGTPAKSIDRQPSSPVREAFSRSVHRRDVASILRFWQRRVFAGIATPPPQARDDDEVLAFVRENPGGIGYVSARANIDGVVTLTIADLEAP